MIINILDHYLIQWDDEPGRPKRGTWRSKWHLYHSCTEQYFLWLVYLFFFLHTYWVPPVRNQAVAIYGYPGESLRRILLHVRHEWPCAKSIMSVGRIMSSGKQKAGDITNKLIWNIIHCVECNAIRFGHSIVAALIYITYWATVLITCAS